jgi:hypothetical protein
MDRQTFIDRIENEEIIPARRAGSDYAALYEALLMGQAVQRLARLAQETGETLACPSEPDLGGADLRSVTDRDTFFAHVEQGVADSDYDPAFEAVLMGSALQELSLEASARDEKLELLCHGELGYWEAALGSIGVTGPSFLGVTDLVGEALSEEPYASMVGTCGGLVGGSVME